MDAYLLWAVTGIVLIIVEMLTGTFYLLVLAIAALAAAAAAWSRPVVLGAGRGHCSRRCGRRDPRQPFPRQEPAGVAAGAGCRAERDAGRLDQRGDGLARVKYRNAQWEAQVVGERVSGGTVFYIHAVEGNTLGFPPRGRD